MVVDYYHPKGTGAEERKKFEERFSKNKVPDDIQVAKVPAGELRLLEFLSSVEFIKSNGEGRRLIKQNALKINFKAHKEESLEVAAGEEYIIKLGKLRMIKVIGE